LPVPSGTSASRVRASSPRARSRVTAEVQAAVAAGDDQGPPVEPVERRVEVGGSWQIDSSASEEPPRGGHRVLVGAAGLRAGDQQVSEGWRAHVG
jgi:hypothetical protein